MRDMNKLVEMVGENAEIRQDGVSVPVKVRSVNSPHSLGNATDTWQIEVSPAEKERGASWYARGWMAHASTPGAWGLRVPKDSTKCAICGKRFEGSGGRLKHTIGAGKYDSMRAVKWIDVSRPVGDHERWAHPKCLHAVRNDKSKWPAGLVFVDTPESVDEQRQDQALKILIEQGRDRVDAHRAVTWVNGREPAIIGELLDKDKLVPKVGDIVSSDKSGIGKVVRVDYSCADTFVEFPSRAGLPTYYTRSYLANITLISRDGKVIDRKYSP